MGLWNYKFLFYNSSNSINLIKPQNKIKIEIDTSGSYINEAGPAKFSRGLSILLPFIA